MYHRHQPHQCATCKHQLPALPVQGDSAFDHGQSQGIRATLKTGLRQLLLTARQCIFVTSICNRRQSATVRHQPHHGAAIRPLWSWLHGSENVWWDTWYHSHARENVSRERKEGDLKDREVANVILHKSADIVHAMHRATNPGDEEDHGNICITVSLDGTWQKRGHRCHDRVFS